MTDEQVAESRERRLDMQHLQMLEGNSLDAEQVAMFEMFERERWSHDKCLAYLLQRARQLSLSLHAAE